MKYAFILGTSAYIVPQGVISYADVDDDSLKEIVKINSLWHDTEPNSYLSVDLDIRDLKGNGVILSDNKALGDGVQVIAERKSVKVLAMDGSTIIKLQQLDDETAMGLEHNIVAELEVNSPVAVIRIFGDFMTNGLHVMAENEKLFINDDGYATSALAGNSLRFTSAGVVL